MTRRPPRWYVPATVAFSLAGLALVLFLANAAVEWSERRGWVSTRRGVDDALQLVDGPLYEAGPGGLLRTTPYAETNMVRAAFAARKGGAWRAFVLGESFAMGVPYSQSAARDRPGGIVSFLQADLSALAPGRTIELINAAAAGQDSNRVRRVAGRVLKHEPDVLLVAMCNNEGVLPPGAVTESVRRFGGARLLLKLLSRAPERVYHTPQDPDTARVRDAFRANLRAILDSAAAANVPVLLATMPVNLRYDGDQPGHVIYGGPEPAPSLPCAFADDDAVLRACPDVEALRRLGRRAYARADYAEARRLLEQYAELVPRNRCRPSFNRVIREEALASPHVRLVDLEKAAERLSPHGLPGDELFLDYCHMHWKGYAAMADVFLSALREAKLSPESGGRRPTREELRARFGLHEDPRVVP